MRVGITGPVKFSFKTGDVDRQAIAFWCCMIPRKLFDEIGLLDEVFSPGTGEDGDFCIKAQVAGYDLAQVPLDGTHSFGVTPPQNMYHLDIPDQVFPIMHAGSATFGYLQADGLIARNKQILDERWGSRLEAAYDWCLNHESDINQHFPVLRKYASQCSHITEFGTRGVFSTYALMAGKPKKLLTYDIELNSNIWVADSIAKENGIEFGFMHRDTTNCKIEDTDLLLIDTYHVGAQLRKELDLHSGNVNKYIVLHDTTTFGEKGEDGGPGIWRAVEEFLLINPQWQLRERFTHNNGLTILERK